MNLEGLVHRVWNERDRKETKTAVEEILLSAFFHIAVDVACGEDVRIQGFGKFQSVDRAARNGVNPQTGKTIRIAARKGVKFTAAKALKEQVNVQVD